MSFICGLYIWNEEQLAVLGGLDQMMSWHGKFNSYSWWAGANWWLWNDDRGYCCMNNTEINQTNLRWETRMKRCQWMWFLTFFFFLKTCSLVEVYCDASLTRLFKNRTKLLPFICCRDWWQVPSCHRSLARLTSSPSSSESAHFSST